MLRKLVKQFVPQPIYAWVLPRVRQTLRPVSWGNMRRTSPVSSRFGSDRGQPIDRYYIESFLARNRAEIFGSVLEIGDPRYTLKFGAERVTQSDVLSPTPGNPLATLVADLQTAHSLPPLTFDCIIITQTFLFIYDLHTAITNCYEALRPGGVLLCTVPGISQIVRSDMNRYGDYWRFTDASSKRLFGAVFGADNVVVNVHGNVLAACAFLYGLASSELKSEELDVCDPDYQVIITVWAKKC